MVLNVLTILSESFFSLRGGRGWGLRSQGEGEHEGVRLHPDDVSPSPLHLLSVSLSILTGTTNQVGWQGEGAHVDNV